MLVSSWTPCGAACFKMWRSGKCFNSSTNKHYIWSARSTSQKKYAV